jgi:hypothetical protein
VPMYNMLFPMSFLLTLASVTRPPLQAVHYHSVHYRMQFEVLTCCYEYQGHLRHKFSRAHHHTRERACGTFECLGSLAHFEWVTAPLNEHPHGQATVLSHRSHAAAT